MSAPALKGPVDILAFGPHPDDVEIGAAATLAKESSAGRTVVVADLTAGEMGTNGDPQTRLRESRRAAEILGLSARTCLGLPDAFLGTEVWHADLVAGVIRALRPAVVMAPWKEDRHPDHRAGHEIVRRAAFLAGLARHSPRYPSGWLSEPDPVPFRPRRIFYYLINSPARPDVLVDVGGYYHLKRAALGAYASQFASGTGPGTAPAPAAETPLNSGVFLPGVEGRDASFGRHCGVAFAEGFVGERFPLLDSLLDVISCR